MEYEYGVQTLKLKPTSGGRGRGKRKATGVRTPNSRGRPAGENLNTAGNPPEFCPIPGVVPVEGTEEDALIVTQHEKRAIADAAMQRQLSLPELMIIENSIALFSYEKLKKIAECKVDNTNDQGMGSVNDPRMGVIESSQICQTCHLDNNQCPGHLGYIDLNDPIYHPFFYREIIQVLNCVCGSCSRLILTKEEIEEREIHKYSLKDRLDLLEEASLGSTCRRKPQKTAGGAVRQCKANFIYVAQKIKENYEVHYKREKSEKDTEIMSLDKVKGILEAIPDEDAKLLGFTPEADSRPINMILQALPVTPPITRYPTPMDGVLRVHPITIQYIRIIGLNNKLLELAEAERKETRRNLIQAITHLFENSKEGAAFTAGKQFRSFKDLIQGKDAVIRGLLMGKRGNYIARTVLSPDPSLKFGQIGVPRTFAPYLTRQETCNQHNKHVLEALMEERDVIVMTTFGGEPSKKPTIRRERKATHIIYGVGHPGKVGQRIELLPGKRYSLLYGDKLERYLQNGDMIVAGRQPTLHKQNLMAYEVVLRDEMTIGLHLSYSTPMNADFDGDEGSFYALMNYDTVAEAQEVMNVQKCILTASENKNIVGLVMDSVTAANWMTADYEEIEYISPVEIRTVVKRRMVDIDTFMSCIGLMTEQEQLSTLIERGIRYDMITLPERVQQELGEEVPIIPTFEPQQFTVSQIKTMIQMLLDEELDKGEKIKSRRKETDPEYELYTRQELSVMPVKELKRLFFANNLNLPEVRFERISPDQVRTMIRMLVERGLDKSGRIGFRREGKSEVELYTEQELANLPAEEIERLFYSNSLKLPDIEVVPGKGPAVPKKKVTILDLWRTYGLTKLPGKLLFSALLPEDFYYEEEGVLIRDGILISGAIGKQHVGPYVHRSIIQMLHKQYGVNRTVAFLTDAPWVLNHYFTEVGFTVGPKDCQFKSTYRFDLLKGLIDAGLDKNGNINKDWKIEKPKNLYTPEELDKLQNEELEGFFKKNNLPLPRKQSELAKEALTKTRLEIEALGPKLDDPLEEAYREQQIIMKVKDIKQFGIKIATEAMQGDNSLRVMISGAGGGGAKGSAFNVAQTLGMLGQPFFKGQRIGQTITNRMRCLPHFPLGSEALEARGFCKHSFWEGMTPAEFFFHLYGSREGILDTAMNTQQSGDMHHRIVKGLENISIKNDGSVRNMVKTIFQVVYGVDGMGAENLINVKTETGTIPFFMDIELEAKKLNAKAGWIQPIKKP